MSGMHYLIILKFKKQIWKSPGSFFNQNTKVYTVFVSIYHHFSSLIMSTRLYLCSIQGKTVKFTGGPTRHLIACKDQLYLKLLYEPPQHKFHNKQDASGGNWEGKSDLLGETVTNATANGIFKRLTENTPQTRLFVSKSLSMLREKWFNSHEFPVAIPISHKKFKYPRSKHKISFFSFNNQLDYDLAHYFVQSETTKCNLNKFSTNLLMTSLTEKLSLKNADK